MKVPVSSLPAVRQRLAAAGGRLLSALTLEENWVLDDGRNGLRAAGRLLRVRRAGHEGSLTLKEPGSFADGIKSRVELETVVGDAERTLAILGALGFRTVRRYQKRRETWALGAIVVALDETPMGDFVELEGAGASLAAAAADLGLDPRDAAHGTYLDLWAAYRDAHPALPEDMVFAG